MRVSGRRRKPRRLTVDALSGRSGSGPRDSANRKRKAEHERSTGNRRGGGVGYGGRSRDRVELRRRVLETRRRVCRPSGRRPVRCPRRPPIFKLRTLPAGDRPCLRRCSGATMGTMVRGGAAQSRIVEGASTVRRQRHVASVPGVAYWFSIARSPSEKFAIEPVPEVGIADRGIG